MRFGIVGTGMIADFHAAAIRDLPGCSLAACMDISAERAEAFAAKHGCEAFSELPAFLERGGVDIVTVCTPSGTHMETAVAAARAGKHLIVEKPMEVTLERIDPIIAACDESGVSLSGVFMSRYGEAARTLKKAVDEGRFGKLVLGSAYVKWWRSQEYYGAGGWKGTLRLDGGGALMNQGIHAVDLLQWLMGPVESVCAYGATLAHRNIEVEDTAVAALRFRSGALGVVEGSTAAYPGAPKRIELCGDRGSAALEEESLPVWKFAEERAEDANIAARFSARSGVGGAADPSAIGHRGHALQFADIVHSIRKGKRSSVDGREARKAVELILAIYRSAQTGREVSLPL
jgi:UDP-N-acetyl-2-amino-2-deoxyglucuronate dehydrogenase